MVASYSFFSTLATFDGYYYGAGYSETNDNPGNDPLFPPVEFDTIPADTSIEDASYQCALETINNDSGYFSFQLLKTTDSSAYAGAYRCIGYYSSNTDPSYFSVADPTVEWALGYSAS